MKNVTKLNINEMSLEQKLGMLEAGYISVNMSKDQEEYVFDLIRRRELGAIWIQWNTKGADEYIKRVRETADYPILIFTDASRGIGDYKIGGANVIGCTGSEKYAYAFGKALGITARSLGYNVVCSPVVDSNNTGSSRYLGSDVREVARLAAAMARGMQDGGILMVIKHYPSGDNPKGVDSHMAEGYSEQTREELLEAGLYPYRQLIKEGLADGIMSGHHRFVNIDPTRPASLSKPMLDIIKEDGFDGFFITDALGMMGIIGKYGKVESKGLCIQAGNDLALSYTVTARENHEAIKTCYENGIFDEERLNDAVRHVLAAQEKSIREPRETEITEEEKRLISEIDTAAIYEKCDTGISKSISKDARHLFALMTRNENAIGIDGKVAVDTFSGSWQNVTAITEKIRENFPNSDVLAFHQFPNNIQMCKILSDSVDYDDVVFITFSEFIAYTGPEHLTRRAESLINAAQSTGKVCALIHFGNPCILQNLPHIPHVIIGSLSSRSNLGCIDVLAGKLEPKGVLTYEAIIN